MWYNILLCITDRVVPKSYQWKGQRLRMSPRMIGEDSLKPKPNPNTEPNTKKRNLETKKERELSRVELQNSPNPPFRV